MKLQGRRMSAEAKLADDGHGRRTTVICGREEQDGSRSARASGELRAATLDLQPNGTAYGA